MKELLNVDLIGIDTNHPQLTIDTLLISASQIKFGKILFFTCADKSEFDPEQVKDIEFIYIPKFAEYLDYSQFCLRLGNWCKNDFTLINHWDSFIVCPELWTDEFLQYDYIGAPWSLVHANSWGLVNQVGNGGFSLRSRKMLEFSNTFANTGGNNEDGMLTNFEITKAREYGIKYAPVDLAYRFSVHHLEDLNMTYDPSKHFGFHGMHNFPIAKDYLKNK